MPLVGFKYKQEQRAAAALAKNESVAAARTQSDREYDLRRAQETADITAIASQGAPACTNAAEEARQKGVRLTGEQVGLAGQELRQKKGEVRAADAKATLLETLARLDDPGRELAVLNANQAVTDAQEQLRLATVNAAELLAAANQRNQDAEALPDLSPAWAKNHSTITSSRVLEADLRQMKADLTRLGAAAAPPGAVAYCSLLETTIDHTAHHVPCSRCGVEHGIDRTALAKAAVDAEVAELERLANLPEDTGLTARQILDRSIGRDLEVLRSGGGGKMIGVLLCQDSLGNRVTLRAFSGDSAGRDDVAGWSDHIPPDGQDSFMTSANGVVVPLSALPVTAGTPHGVCAAPKMIQAAHRSGLTIVGIAEAWYGGGPVQPHGALVASCATCKSNLDIQLCPAYP